ncbi:MAG: beta-lactamase family protein [Deltaproteobacteria bacterium]|nr:beta-lactamase family protein [Deltaproteobacteria bacterium]
MKHETMSGIETLLEKGREEGIYPGAVLLAASQGVIRIFLAVGKRALAPRSLPMEKETLFDLASLTKPLATTMAMMKLVNDGRIGLDTPLQALLPCTLPDDKRGITPRLLLSHAAGFVDWMPFYLELDRAAPKDRKAISRNRLLTLPLVSPPGRRSLYSDLGFMLLEWVIEATAGLDLPRFLNQEFYTPLALEHTGFFSAGPPSRFTQDGFAATEACPWRKRIIQGAVHDENACALGGYSGHAGLFGTAEEVYRLANLLRERWRGEGDDYLGPGTVRTFFTRQDIVKGSTWALGWDTPSAEASSAGRHFSPFSVGHLGFTGTSLWMDLEQDVIVILLTNRIHPTRKNQKIRAFRPLLHDRVMEAFGLIQ